MRLAEAAKIVRSKIAGPFILTIDIFLSSRELYEEVKSKRLINPEVVAAVYRVDARLIRVAYYDQVLGIKVSMPVEKPPGEAGCRDIYGAQQYIPLLGLEIPVSRARRGQPRPQH